MVILMFRSLLFLSLFFKMAFPVDSIYVPLNGTVKMYFKVPSWYRAMNQDVLVGHLVPNYSGHLSLNKFDGVLAYSPDGPHWSVVPKYRARVKYAVVNGELEVTISPVELADAGRYICHDLSAQPLIGCEQFVVVLGKPFQPIISASQVAVEGQPLTLRCHHHTSGQGPNAATEFVIAYWTHKTRYANEAEKGELQGNNDTMYFPSVMRRYKDTFVTCSTRDVFPKYTGSDPLPASDPSMPYHFKPEHAPNIEIDIKIKPQEDLGTVLATSEGEIIKYTCEIQCEPPCVVYWAFKPDNSESYTNLTMVDSNILRKRMDKNSQGTYTCIGSNKHGEAKWSIGVTVFMLEPLEIRINGVVEDAEVLLEHRPLTLTCSSFSRTEKSPIMSWKSHGDELLSEAHIQPQIIDNEQVHHKYKFTTTYFMQTSTCGSPLDYICVVDHDGVLQEHSLHVDILCAPSIYKDDYLNLLPEYETSLNDPVSFSFVVRSVPEPALTKVVSSVNEIERLENFDTDVVVSKENNYDGKHYLTKFTFTTRRQLDSNDFGRRYTMHFTAGNFTETFSFVVMTPSTTTQETTTIPDTTQASRSPRTDPKPKGIYLPTQSDHTLFFIIACIILVVVTVLAVLLLCSQKKAATPRDGGETTVITVKEKKGKTTSKSSKTSQRAPSASKTSQRAPSASKSSQRALAASKSSQRTL